MGGEESVIKMRTRTGVVFGDDYDDDDDDYYNDDDDHYD